ncbi:GOLPH3/VPS74 family protein [Arthrobacter sp. VKM Ac-2550]|uniref:GOLPH3/VPS74 family protein n=1 Tax=Crystallibacter permensis TaxID=1938888 RepID=UPI002227DE75|nr:GPP34 family phosphoprotein [Arthrobacter sp. VKM Ac-2550]MCW2135215.1 Golgi phosphoprotein 3 (GPP34) [Arthrobacter sp. VKM Ac-2550]
MPQEPVASSPLSVPEAFLLLCLRDEDGKAMLDGSTLGYGLGGAILSELALAGAITIQDRKVVPTPGYGVDGSGAYKPFMQLIAAARRPYKTEHWVTKFASRSPKQLVGDLLAARNIVARAEGRILWVFPTVKYPEVDPVPEQQLRERIANVLSGLRPDGFSASVIALADATKILEKRFGPVPKERVTEITDGDWASKAVKDAISAAITAATTATTMTAVSSAGSN